MCNKKGCRKYADFVRKQTLIKHPNPNEVLWKVETHIFSKYKNFQSAMTVYIWNTFVCTYYSTLKMQATRKSFANFTLNYQFNILFIWFIRIWLHIIYISMKLMNSWYLKGATQFWLILMAFTNIFGSYDNGVTFIQACNF